MEEEKKINELYENMKKQKEEAEMKRAKQRPPKTEYEIEVEQIRKKQILPFLINITVEFEALKSKDIQAILTEKFGKQFYTFERIENLGAINDIQDRSEFDKLLNRSIIENTPMLLLFAINNARLFGITIDKQLEKSREEYKLTNNLNGELFSVEIYGNTVDVEKFEFNKLKL